MGNAELIALLREARATWTEHERRLVEVWRKSDAPHADARGWVEPTLQDLLPRIDAAIAAHEDVPVLLAEVERLTDERDAAFARGVAAMREAAVALAVLPSMSNVIRALPDPEDKP